MNTIEAVEIAEKVPHHTDAEIESNIVLEEGESEKVEQLANDIVKAQTTEIGQIYNWYINWN